MSHSVDIGSLPSVIRMPERRPAVDEVGRHAAWQREMERAQLASWFVGDPSRPDGLRSDTTNSERCATSPVRIDPVTPAESASRPYAEPVPARAGMLQGDPRPTAPSAGAGGNDGAAASAASGMFAPAGQGMAATAAVPPGTIATTFAGTGTASREGSMASFGTSLGGQGAQTTAARQDATLVPIVTVPPSRVLSLYAPTATDSPEEAPEAAAAPETAWPCGGEHDKIRVHAEWAGDGVTVWLGLEGTTEENRDRIAGLINGLRQALDERNQRLRRVICNGQPVFEGDGKPRGAVEADVPRDVENVRQAISRFSSLFSVREER